MSARFVTLPDGSPIGLGAYVALWRQLREAPAADRRRQIKGWTWWAVSAEHVLAEMRAGLHQRINRHLPWYGRGRKWSGEWQRDAARTAREVNTPRLVVRWAPRDLRARLAHRLEVI